ncbi:unnamed protein product [Acanthoscelides obtectus]|uniref:Uncharacterized protein n=1 Tax=Acanthoscelides obtectus TaxID=200917 RepID=A0A9P0JLY8_ACAOB|nr:unnamed protein product [Acanthoscelides obtectus]CAK1658129.1 hypothetical protein AOBTE_LOCUS20712 [Acanthoscelides obtectus]
MCPSTTMAVVCPFSPFLSSKNQPVQNKHLASLSFCFRLKMNHPT